MRKSIKFVLLVGLCIILLLCCLLPIGYNADGLIQQIIADPDLVGVTVTGGILEVVIPRSRIPDEVFVSPTGHWLVFSLDNGNQWLILDTQTNQERSLGLSDIYPDIRWVTQNEFTVGYRIIKATDPSARDLEVISHYEHQNKISMLEVLRRAKQVYLLPERGTTSGADVMSGDSAYPYGFSAFEADGVIGDVDYTYRVLQEHFPKTEFVVIEPRYFQPTAGVRDPQYAIHFKDTPSLITYWHYDFPSPDGRFYARSASENWGTNLEIYQCGRKLVAHAVKNNWHIYPKGWAYDNSGFYFLLRPKVDYFTAGEVPISILKLNLPPKVLANVPPYEGEGFCE